MRGTSVYKIQYGILSWWKIVSYTTGKIIVLCRNHLSLVMLKILPFDMFSSSYSKYRHQNKLATEVPIATNTSLFTVFIESLSLSVCTRYSIYIIETNCRWHVKAK